MSLKHKVEISDVQLKQNLGDLGGTFYDYLKKANS